MNVEDLLWRPYAYNSYYMPMMTTLIRLKRVANDWQSTPVSLASFGQVLVQLKPSNLTPKLSFLLSWHLSNLLLTAYSTKVWLQILNSWLCGKGESYRISVAGELSYFVCPNLTQSLSFFVESIFEKTTAPKRQPFPQAVINAGVVLEPSSAPSQSTSMISVILCLISCLLITWIMESMWWKKMKKMEIFMPSFYQRVTHMTYALRLGCKNASLLFAKKRVCFRDEWWGKVIGTIFFSGTVML